ncbi:MAG TPA: hypothetical protein VFJ30_07340 [Phycisphaerae bacterium]|nr:hypothetical protein [Phycisphaerae bacterium]
MFRKIAAALAGAMILLPMGGNLHVALAKGTGTFQGFHLPDAPIGAPEQMIVYPCLIILTVMLSRHRRRAHNICRY